MSKVIGIGKYFGYTLEEVKKTDLKYYEFLNKCESDIYMSDELSYGDKKYEHIMDNSTFNSGKYEGKTYLYVFSKDKGYCEFFAKKQQYHKFTKYCNEKKELIKNADVQESESKLNPTKSLINLSSFNYESSLDDIIKYLEESKLLYDSSFNIIKDKVPIVDEDSYKTVTIKGHIFEYYEDATNRMYLKHEGELCNSYLFLCIYLYLHNLIVLENKMSYDSFVIFNETGSLKLMFNESIINNFKHEMKQYNIISDKLLDIYITNDCKTDDYKKYKCLTVCNNIISDQYTDFVKSENIRSLNLYDDGCAYTFLGSNKLLNSCNVNIYRNKTDVLETDSINHYNNLFEYYDLLNEEPDELTYVFTPFKLYKLFNSLNK
jgi:hypothetical protein